jgi:signal transduction histidine kinase
MNQSSWMNKRLLRWITIVLPVTFVVAILAYIDYFYTSVLTFPVIIIALISISIGITLFSAWIFSFIDQREAEIHRHATQLEALNAASLALTTELDLGLVLQKVVDLSRELVTSRYGALGVLDQTGQYFEQFVTSGISHEERQMIGDPPQGKGLFHILIGKGESIRIDDIASHPKHVGFPEHHPSMTNLLGVPIKTKGKIIGDLYLAEKMSQPDGNEVVPYTAEDQQILEMFATQAAIAIENARLYRQMQQLAILEERQRFGMDLHDGVIQSIYAVGLMLENIQRRVKSNPEESRQGISKAIVSLNNAISDIRNYILDLRPQHFQGRNIVQGVEELARALRANTFMDVYINTDGIDPGRFTPEQTVEILHIAQEALSNVQKHAHASEVDINLQFVNGDLSLAIKDNGVSITDDHIQKTYGNGLRNMRERAAMLKGEVVISPRESGGTEVTLRIPVQPK